MWCFDCKKDVSGKRKEKCREEKHDLDYENLHDGKKIKPREKDERTASRKCYDFAMTKIKKLVISENNSDDVYAIVEVNSHVEAINLSSARARHWLGDEYSRNIESNEIHADDFFKTVLNHIIAKAHMNGTERAQIHYRIAQADDSLIYDLGTPDWQFIKVSAKGVRPVKFDVHLPIFRRSQSIQKHVMPNRDNDKALDQLAELLRIVPRDRLVFKVHIVALFLEAYPIPIMVFDGMAGSLKTTATAAIKRIVDPSGIEKEDNVSAMAEKQDDLILQLQNRYLSSFDNVSSITQATSDVLSRAITGSNNPRRKLYTDDDESIHSFRRKIVLNGIVPHLEYPDLQTRLVSYAREMIDETNRMTEQEFKSKFEELLPFVLGQILLTMYKAIKQHPKLKNQIRPKERMADFEVWGEIISRTLGYEKNEFLNRYHEKLHEGKISSQDSYPIVNAIQFFMENKDHWEGTTSSLYHELTKITLDQNQGIDLKSKYVRFPKSPNYLTKELVIVQPLLKNLGIITETYRYAKNDGKFTKNTAIVKIMKKDSQSTLFPGMSPPSPPCPPIADLGTKTGGATVSQNDVSPPSPPEKADFTHENDVGGGSGDSGATPGKAPERRFYCKTCKAGPFQENTIGSLGKKIIDFHSGPEHEIRYLQEGEDVAF